MSLSRENKWLVVKMEVGKKICLLRKNAGITQEQLAQQLGVSRQTVSKWESGVSLPDIESVVAISRLFQVSLGELLEKSEWKNTDEVNKTDELTDLEEDVPKDREQSGKNQQDKIVSFKTLEELARINFRNHIIILVGVAVFTFMLGIVLGSVFVKKLDNTTSKLEYTLHQYMALEGKVTALVDANTTEQVLLVTDTTYDDGTGRQASCVCEVYYTVNNKVKALGVIMSAGTAYPIATDRTGIYTASGHSVERYVVNEKLGELELAEAVYEIYDENGNVKYEKEVNGERSVSNENEFMDIINDYGRATTVGFQ